VPISSALVVLNLITVEPDHRICSEDCRRARRFQLANSAYDKQSAIDVIIETDMKEESIDLDKLRRGARRKFLQMDQRVKYILDLSAYRSARLSEFRLVLLPWKRYRFTLFTNVMKTFQQVQLYEEDMIVRKIM